MIELYGHPFAAFVWKALIALYERDIAFAFRVLGPDHPENVARFAGLSPTGQFPVLVEGGRSVVESAAIIEYLDLHHGDAEPMVPRDPKAAIEARQMDGIFDDYVAVPMQAIVADALRGGADRDPFGLAAAHRTLDKSYCWLEGWLTGRTWAAGERFGIADCAAAPALFYSHWVHPIPDELAALGTYRARLLARPSIRRVIDEARPFRAFFPLPIPDRD
ncbi:glutathione S-transferase family protein [Consotaella salsifontis]|uniref:Glutathione S-transferase n=1 Tax=Consotaella salsifontis TaxID=1365950 RepID=A0A1T4S0C9_9HYPH|nr:glutathione S-transferase family protein [Consotaella salsifontis]SKA21740.1 glutathione S-transferase [Consotaella salsifontis]